MESALRGLVGKTIMEKSYLVEITDELQAESPSDALREALEMFRGEQTVAKVTCLETDVVTYIECQTGDTVWVCVPPQED